MNSLSYQLNEQQETSQISNSSMERENIISIHQDSDDGEEINIEDQCFSSRDWKLFKDSKDYSLNLESIQNQDTDQQKLIEILQKQQYFELNKLNLKQQLYSVNCFIPEDELENEYSSSEIFEEDSCKQNKSIISEITQIRINEIAKIDPNQIESQPGQRQNEVNQEQQSSYNKEIEGFENNQEQVNELSLLSQIKSLLQTNDYVNNKASIQQMSQLIKEIPYFQQIFNNDGYKSEDILSVCQYLKTQSLEQNSFLFHINDPSDCLYILLDGCMAVYVPKSESDIQQEMNISYNIIQNEKMLNQFVPTNHAQQQAKIDAKIKLEILYQLRNQYFNKTHEDFLKVASNNSQRYFNLDQSNCKFRRATLLKPGDVFGHTALAVNKNRTASVIAINNCTLAKIQGSLYTKYFKRDQEKREFLLQCMKSFFSFPQKNIDKIESFPYLLKEVSFRRNQIIYKCKEEKVDRFYFVLRGCVDMIVRVREDDSNHFQSKLDKQMQNKVRKYSQTKDLCVLTINQGDFFGYEDIFDQKKRNFTAQSSSSETILFEIQLSMLNELDSTHIFEKIKNIGNQFNLFKLSKYFCLIKICFCYHLLNANLNHSLQLDRFYFTNQKFLKMKGQQRKQRCLDRIKEIQDFKQDKLIQKPIQKQLPENIQKIVKEQITQKSLNYQLKIQQDKLNQLYSSEFFQQKEEKFTLEIDPSKNERIILGDVSDYQRAKQKIQKKLEGQFGKQEQPETYYQKISRPQSINNFESCLNYISTVPSFSKLKSNQFLPSLKESIQVFEEQKLKNKLEKSRITRKVSIDEHSSLKNERVRSNSDNIIKVNHEDSSQASSSSSSQVQSFSFQIKQSNRDINYKVLTPLLIKSSYQINLETELINQSKKKKQIDHSTPKSLFSNQNLSPQSKLNNQDEKQGNFIICSSQNIQIQDQQEGNIQSSQNSIRKQRNSSLYLMNEQVQKVKKNRLIERQLIHNKENYEDFQSIKEQNLFQNSKIRAQSLHENKQISKLQESQGSITRESRSFHQSNDKQYGFNSLQHYNASSSCDQIQNSKQELQNQQNGNKTLRENKTKQNEQISSVKILKIKIKNNENEMEQNPLIINQFNKNRRNNHIHKNKIIKSNSTDRRRSICENLIEKKIEELHDLLQPLSKQANIQITNKAIKKQIKGQQEPEQVNIGTSTQDIFKYSNHVILSPIYNSQSNQANNNHENKKFFAEDSFTIQSYRSLNSNKEIKSKSIKLSEADERILQMNSYLKTGSSSQSIENYQEPKIKNHKLSSYKKVHDQIKKFIISPQTVSFENYKINKKLAIKQSNQYDDEQQKANKNNYIQSIIFPDLKYPIKTKNQQ